MSQELLTFNRAAKALGAHDRAAGRRLKRTVFARERESGKRIATRLGSDRMPKYRVTMSALRRHLPELFKSKVEELQEDMRGYLKAIDERISAAAAAHVTEYVEPRLQELWERDEAIAEQVNDLGLRVKLLAEGKSGSDRKRPQATGG